MEVDEPAWPPFDPSKYKVEFPFFALEPVDERITLRGRDETLSEINAESRLRLQKFRPFIISTSRGMGKTFFLKAVGSQRVPENLKNPRIQAARTHCLL